MSFDSMQSLPAIFFWMSCRWMPIDPRGFLISCATPAARVVRDARLSALRSRASFERFSVTSSMCTTFPCTLPSLTSGRRLRERMRGGPPSRVNSRSETFSWLRRFAERKPAISRSAMWSHRTFSMMSSWEKGTILSADLLYRMTRCSRSVTMMPSVMLSNIMPSRSFSSAMRTIRARICSWSILASFSSAFWMNFLIVKPSAPLSRRGSLR